MGGSAGHVLVSYLLYVHLLGPSGGGAPVVVGIDSGWLVCSVSSLCHVASALGHLHCGSGYGRWGCWVPAPVFIAAGTKCHSREALDTSPLLLPVPPQCSGTASAPLPCSACTLCGGRTPALPLLSRWPGPWQLWNCICGHRP